MILREFYDKNKGYSLITFLCPVCKKEKSIRKEKFKNKKYPYCHNCYQKSPEKRDVAQKNAKNRRNYGGKNNPNFKGKIRKKCMCGTTFYVSQCRKNTAKFCSYQCAAAYRPHSIKRYRYRGLYFRSSWEVKFAKYLDFKNIIYKYEPKAFPTLYGSYTPDFWIPSWKSFVEVKGYFRDDAKQKFKEFSKNYKIILADKSYLKSLEIL